jgi:non-ribosomal peptide synthetase component E (peptide arylation enzyme)
MHRFNLTLVALLLAGAAVLGAVAVAHTTHLGAAARQTNDAAFVARTRQLTAFEAKLRQELKAKPPALPRVPKAQPEAPAPVAVAAAAPAAQAPRVVYHQPPPVVHVVHRHGGDGESEDGGGGDD